MVESNTLYLVIKEFATTKGYLGPDKISAVDCGYIFEDLVRRFSESFGEEAGAHFTSRDIIYLMTDLLLSDDDLSDVNNTTVYDMTMGTSQMLSCMEERIHQLNADTQVLCFGQEINPSTFAIAKADMMIRGGDPENMRFGDTLSDDKFEGYVFHKIISNPPFGIDWKREQKAVEAEAKKGENGRFAPGLPKISDGQQLFVLNGLSKLAPDGKMAIIQNGSPLFSGDAGSGPSEIRRYILENDWLDCIVQLCDSAFMNTGISTYIWVLSKNKPEYRAGKVQLIDASHCFEARRKSIGTKRNDITDKCREIILQAYSDYENDKVYGEPDGIYCESKIFETVEFGYNKIVVERPMRQKVTINEATINEFIELCQNCNIEFQGEHAKYNKQDDIPTMSLAEAFASDDLSINTIKLPKTIGQLQADIAFTAALNILLAMQSNSPYMSYNQIEQEFNNSSYAKSAGLKWNQISGTIEHIFVSIDPEADIVYKAKKPVADTALRDTENVPLVEDIDTYFKREVLPYAPDAWIDKKKTKIGYEIPMTRYFYKYQAPEAVEDIAARISVLEADISASLEKLFHEEA